jgi:hypothetical protein
VVSEKIAYAVTPEMRRQDRRRARRRAVRHWLRCQWGWTGYRPTMRVLHRLNLCWMEPLPIREGENGQWINVWCSWCGVRGQRLDMSRATGPKPDPSASGATS